MRSAAPAGGRPPGGPLDAPHALAVAAARAMIDERREELRAGAGGEPDLVAARARAPRARRAAVAAARAQRHRRDRAHQPRPRAARRRRRARRSPGRRRATRNLECDLGDGRARLAPRPRRGARCASSPAPRPPSRSTTAPRPSLLAAAALAGPGREIVVSRGQLVEIGGGFRVPDVDRPGRRDARRGRHHQPHAPGRLRERARRAHRGGPARPPLELPPARLRRRRSRSRSCASSACR